MAIFQVIRFASGIIFQLFQGSKAFFGTEKCIGVYLTGILEEGEAWRDLL